MNENNNQNEPLLSAAGTERRDAILRNAAAMMVTQHRMRRRKRVVGACAIFVIVAGGAILANQFTVFTSSATINHIAEVKAMVETRSQKSLSEVGGAAVQWRIVQSDSTALARYSVSTTTKVEHVGDAELARLLDSIDRPAGVISIGGQVQLTRNVVDEKAGDLSDSPM